MADGSNSAVTSSSSVTERPLSPPPWATPSPALTACPQLDRSVSTASSVSSVSGRSSSSRVSDGGTGRGRRGYMRPQATVFSDSARNRDSVMALGTIAHLQYYFARTGLLDGKGAQLAKETNGSQPGSPDALAQMTDGGAAPADGRTEAALAYLTGEKDASFALDNVQSGNGLVESPVDQEDEANTWGEPLMLPPTVSTYKHRAPYVPPPPDMMVLRRELVESLEDARKVLKEVDVGLPDSPERKDRRTPRSSPTSPPSSTSKPTAASDSLQTPGWYEIQGLHFLDLVTLAIRAAKNYYTAHERPQRLYSIRPERQIRSDLYHVLDVLKRIASRNFAGGTRTVERDQILSWTDSIGDLLRVEEEKERAEIEERARWQWREECDANGKPWAGQERQREWLFLRSFEHVAAEDTDRYGKKLGSLTPFPRWTDPAEATELPTLFLDALSTGLALVRMHNALVHTSRRQFENIRVFHADTTKPYRRAENLRYWAKAAELRWDVKLQFDVMAIANRTCDPTAWTRFDEAVLKWAGTVRQEIMTEWSDMRTRSHPPTLVIDTEREDGSGARDGRPL